MAAGDEMPAELTRLVFALAIGPMRVDASGNGRVRLWRDGAVKSRASVDLIASLAKRGLVVRNGASIALTLEGRAVVARLAANSEPVLGRKMDMDRRDILVGGSVQTVVVNLAESPLSNLMRRKGSTGLAFLSHAEFEAGERLRSDYTRASIMPRVSANWDMAIATGRRGQATSEISDGAVAARIRVEKALSAVGPELSGVLVDVCCFLKGLEVVERERRWPARSAKMLLKAALGTLARHYHPPSTRRSDAILSWGADGFRPSMRP